LAKPIRKAIIPAAGLGTRFLPATKAQPKEMLPIVDTPVIEYAVREAVEAGIDDIIIVTGRGKRAIEDHFDKSFELETRLQRNGQTDLVLDISQEYGADIHFIRQREPLGLGHAILQAAKHIGDEPFAVLLADEIYVSQPGCLKQLVDAYETVGESTVCLRTVSDEEVRRYGIAEGALMDGGMVGVTRLVEKPEPDATASRMAIGGRYILRPELFHCLANTNPGKNGEIQLTDGMAMLLLQRPFYGKLVSAKVYDVGSKLGFLEATVDFALKRPDLGAEFRSFLAKTMASCETATDKDDKR